MISDDDCFLFFSITPLGPVIEPEFFFREHANSIEHGWLYRINFASSNGPIEVFIAQDHNHIIAHSFALTF